MWAYYAFLHQNYCRLRLQWLGCDKSGLRCAGNTEANQQSKVPEDHDSSSGTENPNKAKTGTSEQGGDKQKESSGEQEPTNGAKKDKGGDAESKKDDGANGRKKDDTGSKDKPKAPEGKKAEEPHSEQKQSDKHDIKGISTCSAHAWLCCLAIL